MLGLGLACSFQRKLLYHPTGDGDFEPAAREVPIESLDLTAEDGTRLHAWYLPPAIDDGVDPRTRPAVLVRGAGAEERTRRRRQGLREEEALLVHARRLNGGGAARRAAAGPRGPLAGRGRG